jgi:hypothetical protein
MTDGELFAFVDVFKGVQRVLGKRMTEGEEAQTHRDYFRALRRFSLAQVMAGAEVCIQRGKYFPKPAEWIDAIPKRQAMPLDIPAMTDQESRDYHRAELMRYTAPPCTCTECVESGMTETPMRFVPEFTADDRERLLRDGERIVTAGHWAHGWELARWYEARAFFYAEFRRVFGMTPKLEVA